MLGIHVNYTIPSRGNDSIEKKYSQPDYDILTTILSALKWREHNGEIKLYTDVYGYKFYDSIGIIDIWNGGVDRNLNEYVSKKINPDFCWAVGKIYAIKEQKSPFCLMDTDLIVWENIGDLLNNRDVCCLHNESLEVTSIYKPIDFYKMKDNYVFDQKWDYVKNPYNYRTSFF